MVNMVVLVKLMIPFLLCHASYAVSHSLKFLLTASSGNPDISELIFVTVVDDMEVVYCDSSKKILEQRQDWVKKAFDDNPDLLVALTYECFEYQPSMYKILISNWKQHLNQSEGVYILQCMTGCEQDEHSGEVKCFCQFSYNVEGLFEFDQKTRTWITLKPDFHISEQMMDGHKNLIKYLENLFSTAFPDILKILLGYGSSSLNKTALPSVSLLQKTPSSPVSCHATGFYPDKAMMFWRKDGVEIHEGVDPGEILPNNDETFQMTVDLNVSSVTHEDWSRYECVFQLSGDEDIITKLDKTVARTNWAERTENPSDTTAPVIATVVVLLIFILIAAVGFAVYKKKKAPENRTEASVRLSRENVTARYI